jgi:hypothetical protein
VGDDEMPGEVRRVRSHVLSEDGGALGADTVGVRADPQPAAT